jgi:hypothetical protein
MKNFYQKLASVALTVLMAATPLVTGASAEHATSQDMGHWHGSLVSGSVSYNAYGLDRHAEFNLSDRCKGDQETYGQFHYSDANNDWYTVDVQALFVTGTSAYFAGPVISASHSEWTSNWLSAAVWIDSSGSGRAIWGVFTDKDTALKNVKNEVTPDQDFEITEGDMTIQEPTRASVAAEGHVSYTAYGLDRSAGLVLFSSCNNQEEYGEMDYSDVNGQWYKVNVVQFHINGNTLYYAGPVVEASDSSWLTHWLSAAVRLNDDGTTSVWGIFTDEPTALHNEESEITPGDAFTVTSGRIKFHPFAVEKVVVTHEDEQGWSTADTRTGGAVTFVEDSTSPSGNGALQLTTDNTRVEGVATAKAQYLHAANVDLADLDRLSYYTKQISPTGLIADPAYQLVVYLNGGTSGFSTLVFEPYQNTAQALVINGVWQKWNVGSGQFWSTRIVACSNGTVNGTSGGPANYTLDQIRAMCPDARVAGFGVNIGSNNPGYRVRTDMVKFDGTVYDFEPTISEPTDNHAR